MKNLLLIIAVVLLAIVAALGGVWYSQSSATPAPAVQSRPLFHPMERFVISVANEHHSRYLVLELTLVTNEAQVLTVLEDAAPLLRNALVEQFANTSHQQARQAFQNIAQVQQSILDRFNTTLRTNNYSQQIEQVLITNVFIQ